ncbi:MAG: hypothetical protein J2P26_07125 [Nocardiopsaceae bacterium]|nr:hypothetical protein [Nocardiopsaceae bacterium]
MKRASLFATAGILGSLLLLPAPGLLAGTAPASATGTSTTTAVATAASTAVAAAAAGAAASAVDITDTAGITGTASTTGTATASPGYGVTTGHAQRIASSPDGVGGLKKITPATSDLLATLRGEPPAWGGGSDPHVAPSARTARAAAAKISRKPAPVVTPSAVTTTAAQPAAKPSHAFNGVSNSDSDALIDGPITPPDQGLCVGADTTVKGSPDAVWEPVNEAARETTKTGARLRPDVSLGTIFQDPYFVGDVRCVYDPPTKTFYFTEIGYPLASGPAEDGNNTTVDVAVVNARGTAEYQFDTSMNGTCFGDQPKTGFDNDALVISTDQYCGPTESVYEGAAIQVISKPQLAAETATVNYDVLGPVSIAGNPVTGLDPAVGTGTGTEYFVDSTSFLGAADVPAPSARTLDLSTLTGTASVTTGQGTPRLVSKTLPSEEYVYPVPAASTGDGSTTTRPDGTVVTSEPAIQPDDDRTSGPVNVTPDPHGGLDLWTSVDTALVPRGDRTARDGSAWFEISTAKQKVVAQGYTAVKGASLVYPAIEALPHGPVAHPVAQVFTITSPSLNPSIAYDELGKGAVRTVAAGAGPHLSFTDAPPYSEPRWGDYSMAVPDPDGSGIWLATEYIPPAADQDPYDNWGTYVFEVPGR